MTRRQGGRAAFAAIAALLLLFIGAVAPAPAAVDYPGTPYTWGSNPNGQLGDGSFENRFSAAAVSGLDDAVEVAAGRGHAVALRAGGSVVGWGQNDFGQVGDGSAVNRSLPVPVSGLSGIAAVAAGHYHTLALRNNGTVVAWGFNASGQLGDGTTQHRAAPVAVTGLTNVVAISGGRNMSYALRGDGTVWGWGLNSDGQLGDGTTTNRITPVRVGSLDGIITISGGRDHGLAVAANGSVWAWGDNEYGQLGDDSQVDRTSPVSVTSIDSATDVAAGAHHSYALLDGGSVAAWGRNYRGQLGNGTTQLSRTPVLVNAVSGAIAVGTGRDHGLAVLAGGTVRAWGWNDFGQLGDGTTDTRLIPITVSGVTDVASADGGQDFSAVLTSVAPVDLPPSQPGRPSGVSSTAGTIDLIWVASSDDLTETLTYGVFRDGGAVGSVISASNTVVAFVDASVVPGTAHTYHVIATDGSGNSSPPSPESEPIRERSPMLADDFSSGDLQAWTKSVRLTIDGTTGSPTAPSAKVALKAKRKAYARFTLPQTVDAACASGRVLSESTGDEAITLLRVRTDRARSIARVKLNPGGRLVLRSDVTAIQRNSGVKLGAGWHEVEACIDVPGQTLELALDGVVIISWDVALGADPIGEFQLGESQKRTYRAHFDSVVVDPVD